MKPGAKGAVLAPPLDFTGWTTDRARRRERFIAEYLVVPRGVGVGEPFQLREFQREIIRGAFAPGVRTALVSIPRANGKTMLAATLTLAEMFVGPPSAEVLCVASDARQAAHVLKYAKRLVELNPILAEHVHVYSDRLYLPENDAVLLPLPAEPDALHGYDPSLLIVDELHVVTTEVWEACTSVGGKRKEQLTLCISTPASSPDSVMWRLVQRGREGGNPSFYFREWAAPPDCDTDDRRAWRTANPALACRNPFLTPEGLEDARLNLREPTFRQLRLGLWAAGVDAWLPWGAWEACQSDRPVRGRVVFGFDGSASGDSTALVGCTLDGHLWLEGLWENDGTKGWRVPRSEVDAAVANAFKRYDVAQLACDPYHWRSEIERWQKRFGERRVIEFNTAAAQRMGPATNRLYQAVVNRKVTHDGNADLAAHVAHCKAKSTPQGDVITKNKRGSSLKTDAATAAIVAYETAARLAGTRNRTMSFPA